jgi:hypothetical protein
VYQPIDAPKPSGLAVASMVLGIISLVLLCIPYISIPCAIVGLVLGLVGNGKAGRGEAGGGGMAKAGIVCTIIALAADALIIILGLSILHHGMQQFNQQFQQQMQQQQHQQQTPPPTTQP